MNVSQEKAIELYGGSCFTCIRPRILGCWSTDDIIAGCKHYESDYRACKEEEVVPTFQHALMALRAKIESEKSTP